ncbi:MAG TPA: O-antigen ligase family protein [Gemmatimonadaceae bacterium]|nr:O-antigen ligase family protein [Gemmatimonadaceae bacterium]
MRRAAANTGGFFGINSDLGPVIAVGTSQMTLALAGLALYLFCVHSFKLPLASVGIAIGVLGVLTNPKGLTVPAPFLLMSAFLGWCALAAANSQFKGTVGPWLIDYLKILLIFFVALNASKTISQLAVFVGLWVLMFGLFPARGTYFNFLAGINQFGRYGWNFSFANYNDLAAYTILCMALSAFLLVSKFPKWVRRGALISTAGLALMVIITQSRGAFLATVIAFFFMLLRSRSRTKLIKFGCLAALGITMLAPGAVWERFSRMKYLFNTDTLGEADTSAQQRYVLLQIATTIAKENMVTGVGLGAYTEAHGMYAEERQEWQFGRGNRDAHNMYVNLAAETGIPGLLVFLGMLGSVLLRALRTEKALRGRFPIEAEQLRILRFGLVAYMIAGIFGSFHRVSFLWLYLAVVWTAATLFEEMAATSHPGVPMPGPMPQPSPLRGGWRGSIPRRGRGTMVPTTR